MRIWICLLTAWAVLGCQPAPQSSETEEPEATTEFIDPAVVNPDHVQVEIDNDSVRVLRETYATGDVAPMHSHEDRVTVYLTDIEVETTSQGGSPQTRTIAAGTVSWADATTHTNSLKSAVEVVSIELKPLEGETTPLSEVDATVVDPDHHVVELENDRVRVLRMTYPAGTKSPRHDHPPGVNVLLTDARTRNVTEGQEPVETEAKAGFTAWSDGAPAHVTENVGEDDVVVIRVEMKKKPSSGET